MPLLNHPTREINLKVVYYGPAFSGKTTNLQYIHSSVAPGSRGELVSMATQSDRTLFFDFMPLDLGRLNGWKTRLFLYTVPGQVQYNASRKLILSGADAVVFVADSDATRSNDNVESLQSMFDSLAEYNIGLHDFPWVLQYNKRDLKDAAPIERLEQELNSYGVPAIESVACDGTGIFSTLKTMSKLLITHVSALID
jgi:signal recognition particle receptor subunit beta